MTKLLIIVPAYNEEAVIRQTVLNLLSFFRSRSEFDTTVTVADSSDRDSTRRIVKDMLGNNPDLIHDEFVDGAGKGEKIREATLRHPGYAVYAFIDADLPVSNDEFLEIIKGVSTRSFNISIASKYISGGGSNRPFHRVFVSRLGNWFFNLFLRLPVHDFIAGAKAWDRSVTETVWPDVLDNSFFFDTELLYLAYKRGFTITENPVCYNDPRVMESKSGAARLGFEFFKNTWKLMGRR